MKVSTRKVASRLIGNTPRVQSIMDRGSDAIGIGSWVEYRETFYSADGTRYRGEPITAQVWSSDRAGYFHIADGRTFRYVRDTSLTLVGQARTVDVPLFDVELAA